MLRCNCYIFIAKVRENKCQERQVPVCSVRDNLCETDFDCPGHQFCVSDGCRLRCTTCEQRKCFYFFLFFFRISAIFTD